MTITKYTFFSPNGNDFPVTANADAKLYMALGNLDYTTFSRVDWSNTTQAGLTKTFVKTSFVVAGRFFQAENELVQLHPAATNFIHAVIDLSTPLNPVKFTSETTDNSNTIDINNSSGIYKRCVEKIVTNSGSIISTEKIAQNRIFDIATIKKAVINTANVVNSNVSGTTNLNTLNTSGKAVLSILEVKNSTLLKNTTISGNLTVSGVTTSKYFTATESVTSKNVTSKNVTSNNVIAENAITSKNVIAENTLIVKAVKGKRSEQFQTPTTYATITGTALKFFTLYKSANVVTCNFGGTPTSGSIPGGGAIVGWITDNAFKPEHTQNFTVFAANGQRCRFTVDPGGAVRSHEPVGKNVEIWDSMQWIVAGTEGGAASK
ncbi:receptor binding protein 1 [Lactococcus phage 936 group phage Phi4.2]|uniref:Receptor binding protein 1 n=1 Tax=Lactococcus phage 936 group phage Phi4.2 TaxID=1636566 RepID=A0A126HC17_9CAUD|nr:receptor binding protein 1 [Lactococcus phage 936 group phage Phi4.2]ALM64135.1 receptor binding protein 1 [Lactococcus phage 936 group phage Phi4.2]